LVGAIDPPPLDQTTCGAGKKKCISKYLKGLLKCHQLAQTPGRPNDPNANSCITRAQTKYDGGSEPAKGCFEKLENKNPNDCQILDDSAALAGLVQSCVTNLVGVVTNTMPSTTTSSTMASSTTTTTTGQETTTTTTLVSGCFTDTGDGTIHDTCTGLQWEKKTTAVQSGVNAADLHDVDNPYSWAGSCTVGGALCQPNAAAAATCAAHSDGGTEACSTCASGTCAVGGITTVWDWLNQVNAANFAGHNDWRLPSEGGCYSCFSGNFSCPCTPHELETILVGPYPCATYPSINSIFGSTLTYYWSASAVPGDWHASWVGFDYCQVSPFGVMFDALSVRAVR
jgi:hypothetical protein